MANNSEEGQGSQRAVVPVVMMMTMTMMVVVVVNETNAHCRKFKKVLIV
jgi:hypothetical protein